MTEGGVAVDREGDRPCNSKLRDNRKLNLGMFLASLLHCNYVMVWVLLG